jgi:hypothetical protein
LVNTYLDVSLGADIKGVAEEAKKIQTKNTHQFTERDKKVGQRKPKKLLDTAGMSQQTHSKKLKHAKKRCKKQQEKNLNCLVAPIRKH